MGISSLGVGSGLDIAGLVQQLLAAERAPVQSRLDRKEAFAQAQLSAYGTLKSNLTALDEALDALTGAGNGRTATSSNEDIIAATASSGAVPGRYAVKVSQLAAAHALASPSYTSPSATVGIGTLTIEFGTTVYDPDTDTYTSFTPGSAGARTLTIDSSNNTVEGIRDAINEADIGVNAVVVNDGTGYRLLLSSASGANNSMRITVSNDAGSGLQDLAFNGTTRNVEQTVAASDALLTINGLDVSSASNDVGDVIDGVSFGLKAETTDEVFITVDNDRAASSEGMDQFVAAFNTLLEQVRELTKFNPDTGEGAILAGDGTARSIASQLRSALLTPVDSGDDAYRYLVNIGIKTASSGKLEVDESKLSDALDADFGAVSTVLGGAATALQDLIASFTESEGLIDARTDGLNARIDDIGDQRIRLDDRMVAVEARLMKQFTALDSLLAQLQNTSSYLAQQLANIPVPGRD
jgi:flagellar hook-associated protein 2